MGKRYLLDSNTVIDYIAGLYPDKAVQWLNQFFLKKYPHPQHNKYLDLKNFKKFKIDGGNIIWGKNWDLIFNPRKLYEGVNPS